MEDRKKEPPSQKKNQKHTFRGNRKKGISTKKRVSRQQNRSHREKKAQKSNAAAVVLKKIGAIGEGVLSILFLALCIWMFFNLSTHKVTGTSMEPTLSNGDRIIIKKTKEIKRNDIVTFNSGEKDNFVKRVVGLPGDGFYVQGVHLYLFPAGLEFDDTSELVASEKLPDSTVVLFLTEEVSEELQELDKIPDYSYFVVGDNRRESTDSRSFSFVKESQIEGVLAWRALPFSSFGFVH